MDALFLGIDTQVFITLRVPCSQFAIRSSEIHTLTSMNEFVSLDSKTLSCRWLAGQGIDMDTNYFFSTGSSFLFAKFGKEN